MTTATTVPSGFIETQGNSRFIEPGGRIGRSCTQEFAERFLHSQKRDMNLGCKLNRATSFRNPATPIAFLDFVPNKK